MEWENFADGVCSDAASTSLAVARLNWTGSDFTNTDVLFNNQYSFHDTLGAEMGIPPAPFFGESLF